MKAKGEVLFVDARDVDWGGVSRSWRGVELATN